MSGGTLGSPQICKGDPGYNQQLFCYNRDTVRLDSDLKLQGLVSYITPDKKSNLSFFGATEEVTVVFLYHLVVNMPKCNSAWRLLRAVGQ